MDEKAELLFTQTFWRTNTRFFELERFRRVTKQVQPQVEQIAKVESGWLASSLASGDLDRYITDKEGFLAVVGGKEGLIQTVTKQRTESYQASIDAACIILAHSILDAAAYDYFRVVEMVASPDDLLPFVAKRQVTLEEIRGSDYKDVAREKIQQFVSQLKRESLLEKIDRLFQACRPPANFEPVRGHKYNRQRVLDLDNRRHEIVHGEGLKSPLLSCDDDIKYLVDTASFLLCLVHEKYQIRVNPTLWKEWMQQQTKK